MNFRFLILIAAITLLLGFWLFSAWGGGTDVRRNSAIGTPVAEGARSRWIGSTHENGSRNHLPGSTGESLMND